MKIKVSDPINAHKHLNHNGIIDEQYAGLTKREYFAAMAMQGMLAAFSDSYHASPENTAQLAVKYADALIEQLNK